VRLSDYLDADGQETAAREANEWIKAIRLARVDGLRFRERFMYLGDSLWWFAELYLHKERAILELFRTLHAGRALLEREAPRTLRFENGGRVSRLLLPQLAHQQRIKYGGPSPPRPSRARRLLMDVRSAALMLAAVGSPNRPSRRQSAGPATIAAFVHRAFWRAEAADGSAESYIGPVLQALERKVPPGTLRYVGIGPTTNFRARRWWRASAATANVVQPVETLVPRSCLAGSSGLWRARHAMRRAMEASADLRRAAIIGDCDCWPIVAEALAGVALLQFPWSARAMDEAGAAFDVLQPRAALTYAEAGGWGRALALEARRRAIPMVGLQHGFIYRHWLNYLHEPDEMHPLAPGSSDAGFPRPAATLVFDEYAARHLRDAGHFPADTVTITGSPRLDQLAARFAQLDRRQVDAARQACGADGTRHVLLLVTKYTEVKPVFSALLDAVRAMPDAQLAIKTHPAETSAPYEAAAAGIPNVRVLPASADLAPLLAASRALVTVNSTVALDGLTLGVPGLSIGLPNNLSPFVTAGALAGARTAAEIRAALQRLLYDEGFRQGLSATAAAVVAEYRMVPESGAAERSASAVLDAARSKHHQE
jgi:Capsule polysaccharide biosynthesis protein